MRSTGAYLLLAIYAPFCIDAYSGPFTQLTSNYLAGVANPQDNFGVSYEFA